MRGFVSFSQVVFFVFVINFLGLPTVAMLQDRLSQDRLSCELNFGTVAYAQAKDASKGAKQVEKYLETEQENILAYSKTISIIAGIVSLVMFVFFIIQSNTQKAIFCFVGFLVCLGFESLTNILTGG